VKLDTEKISKVEFVCTLRDEWEKSMKEAISADLAEEGWIDEGWEYESRKRYETACSEVIGDLLFGLKWGMIETEKLDRENKQLQE
jgi:hypothetical protein